MITLLTGDNSFELDEARMRIIADFDGPAEKIDGTTIELRDIPDLLMGSTLFAQKRLVIIRDLSKNNVVWEKLSDWLPRLSDDIHLVLIDEKPDKRTVAYKELKKVADIREYNSWSDRDWGVAEAWLVDQSKAIGLALDKQSVHHIVERVGLDQWQLRYALEKLLYVDTINQDTINAVIDANPSENVFQLFELALEGKTKRLHEILSTLELTEEPYRLFALLSSQAIQLAAIAQAGSEDVPTKDFGIHPYVASKLAKHAKKVGKHGAMKILRGFAKTDADLKRSRGEPWLLIERTLVSLSA